MATGRLPGRHSRSAGGLRTLRVLPLVAQVLFFANRGAVLYVFDSPRVASVLSSPRCVDVRRSGFLSVLRGAGIGLKHLSRFGDVRTLVHRCFIVVTV